MRNVAKLGTYELKVTGRTGEDEDAPLSSVVGRSDFARCGRLTIIAYRLSTPLRPPIDTGAGG